jgi:hypothetical protein
MPADHVGNDYCMIPVRKLRDLDLDGADVRDHVSAASGLVRSGDTLFVVADDSHDLAIFPATATKPGRVMKILDGEMPADHTERKKHKRDLESLVQLPHFEGAPYGALLALGSGSGPPQDRSGSRASRDYASLIQLGENGNPTGSYVQIDFGALYDSLRHEITDLNLEGATLAGQALHLFQRGDNEDSDNARIGLDLAGVTEALAHESCPGSGYIRSVERYDLGRLHGVKLCFSDATTLGNGRIMFAASAENTRVGHYVGSAFGMLGDQAELLWCEPVDAPAKLEGLTARILDPDGADPTIEMLMVSDADDPDVASPLTGAEIPLRG